MPASFTSSMYSPYGLNISPAQHVRNDTATSSTTARPQSIPSVVPAEHDVPDYGNRIPGRVTAGRLTFSVGSVISPLTDESRKLLRAALSQIDPQQDPMKDSNNMASYFAEITTHSGQPADLLVTVMLDNQNNLVRLAGNICPDNGNPPEGDKPPELDVGFAPASPQQKLYTPSGRTAPPQTGQNIPLTVSAGPSSLHHSSPVNAEIPVQTAGTEASATLAGKRRLPSVDDEVLMTYLRTSEGVVRNTEEILHALHQDGLGANRHRVRMFTQTHLPPSSRMRQIVPSLAVTEAVARKFVEEKGVDKLNMTTLARYLKIQSHGIRPRELPPLIDKLRAEQGLLPANVKADISEAVLRQEILTPLPNGALRNRRELTRALSKNYNFTEQSITEAIARLQAEGKVIGGQPTGKKLSLPPENPWVPVAPDQASLGYK